MRREIQPKLSHLFSWRGLVFSGDGPSSTCRLVMAALSLHMSAKGDSCFPSQDTLALETGLSSRAVRKALKEAEAKGWVVRKKIPLLDKGRGWNRTEYTASIPRHLLGTIPVGEVSEERNDVPHVDKDRNDVPKGPEPRSAESVIEDVNPKGAGKPPPSKWTECARLLSPYVGSERKARNLLGGWCKDHKHADRTKEQTDGEVFDAVKAAIASRVAEPVAYVSRVLQEKRHARGPQVKRLDPYATRIEVRDVTG